ncbi:CoA transferase [Sporichthya sp.]|uniref:CaiB/BaiF CoA transferase family protein n=1 Tax=Sporichthya sp. TaxID=65475 RepID=UPI0017F2F679|nr:CoA transferase [Sporichthya sp.]MBA3741426.1 CoA transferase [Sporichthya sp.]
MSASASPLAGIRVIEIGGYIAAPYATSLLCSLGAEVIKIEQPEGGDAFRRNLNDRSPYFAQYNSGKRSVAIDLRHVDGNRAVRKLIATSDVLLDNLRPGRLDTLGLGRTAMRELNAQLIQVSVTGFGAEGPLAARPAYDSVGQSYGGLYSLLNDEADERLTGTCLADLITGLVTATGVLAALNGRSRTGAGGDVDTSMLEGISTITIDAMTQLSELGRAPKREARHPQAQSFVVTTADGGKFTLHLSSSQNFWGRLVTVIGREDLLTDPDYVTYPDRVRNYVALREQIAPAFRSRSSATWDAALTGADVPFAPVLDLAEVTELPQVKLLEMFTQAPDNLNLVRAPWRFDGSRPERDLRVPRLGEHTIAVLSAVLGAEEIASLLAAGTAVNAEPPT